MTVLTSTLTPQNGTNVVIEKEMKIETVIVILWATGGVLLLALMVLLACILKSNKKGRTQRPSVFGITDSCVGTRHGGVNPGFTNYDEIWTWIPVVRGNQDECPRASAQEVEPTHSSAPSTSDTLSRTLEPPPYSVAISTPSYPPPSTRYTTAPSTSGVQQQTNSVSTEINVTSSILTTTAITSPVVSSSESISQNTYAERLRESSRNLLRRGQTSGRQERQCPSKESQSRISRNDGNRVYRLKSSSCTNNGDGIHSCKDERSQANDARRDVRHDRHQNERISYRDVRSPRPSRNRNSRRCLISEYEEAASSSIENTNQTGSETPPIAHASRTSREFSYDAEAGLYSFSTGTNGRRVWCDIPPSLMDEEGPPPYTPPPDYPLNHPNSSARISSRNDRTAPIVRSAKRPAVLDIRPIYSPDWKHGPSFGTRGLNMTTFDESGLLISRV